MQAHATAAKTHKAPQSFPEDRQLMELVRSMSLEIERLTEDNAQLRAAVDIYREVLRRYDPDQELLVSEPHVH
jgi:hypothetical protein